MVGGTATAAPAFDPWQTIRESSVRDNDRGYGDFVVAWPLDYYRKRVRQLGFTGHRAVLDVGCGFGQWSAALALENGRVVSLEIHEKRLATARTLLAGLGLDNFEAVLGSAVALPFPDASFDALFCYGVIMFVDRAAALAEFARVLRPGGRLYVCANGRGWWLKLAVENMRKNRALAKVGWTGFRHGRAGAMPNAIDIRDVRSWLKADIWQSVEAGPEGSLGRAGSDTGPVYQPSYWSYDCVIEFTATKRGSAAAVDPHGVTVRLDTLAREIQASRDWSPREGLGRYPMPRPVTNMVEHTNAAAVHFGREAARAIDRTDALRRIYAIATAGLADDEACIRACITLAQKRFYHHFAGQPMQAEGVAVLDPISSFLIGACRCGNVARFLVDLFEVNGHRARLLGGACHTSSEVELDGRWVFADASLYPPGIVPLRADGAMLGLEDAVADPAALDRVPNYVNYESGHIAAFRDAYPEAYEPIARWLEGPILPSVAFFGAAFASGKPAGRVQRWSKNGGPSDWEADGDYGWFSLVEASPVDGPALATVQRPGQVTACRREGAEIVWDAPPLFGAEQASYAVTLSRKPRGWSYERLPVGFDFAIAGETVVTSQTRLALPDWARQGPLHVTLRCWTAETAGVFVLPSPEFAFA